MRIPTPVSVYVYKVLYVLIFKEHLLHYLLYIYCSITTISRQQLFKTCLPY